MKKLLIILLTISFSQLPALAQEEEVKQVISSLFEGMKSKNEAMLFAAFHQDAIMHTVKDVDSFGELGNNTVAEFVSGVVSGPPDRILDEQILDYHILIDGNMAFAWTPYQFYVNDQFSHCGVNSFQLIKTKEGWKITYVIDTRRKEPCD